jgi:signal peptidase I
MSDSEKTKTGHHKVLMEKIVIIGMVLAFVVSVHVWVGQLVTVSGPSMQPCLVSGEIVLVGKVEYYFSEPKRGDIVLARFPNRNQNFIKRVIALGGEKVQIISGMVYIDGKKLEEPYVSESIKYDMEAVTVPEDYVFLMGDNRNDSTDSHNSFIGPIPLNQVQGRAYVLVWPFGKIAKITGYTGKLEQ